MKSRCRFKDHLSSDYDHASTLDLRFDNNNALALWQRIDCHTRSFTPLVSYLQFFGILETTFS
jgi:hypothetical protein